jgi:hypothetical protein
MRLTMFACLLASVFAAGAASAQGTDGKFCAQMKGDPGKAPNCSYQTMAQCQETVKADQGTCIENPKNKK